VADAGLLELLSPQPAKNAVTAISGKMDFFMALI
jgi:hypothetical protein